MSDSDANSMAPSSVKRMQAHASVHVNLNGRKVNPISVSVGSGKQSIKWLATVVKARLEPIAGPMVVIEMKNNTDGIVNPHDLISEHLDTDTSTASFVAEVIQIMFIIIHMRSFK